MSHSHSSASSDSEEMHPALEELWQKFCRRSQWELPYVLQSALTTTTTKLEFGRETRHTTSCYTCGRDISSGKHLPHDIALRILSLGTMYQEVFFDIRVPTWMTVVLLRIPRSTPGESKQHAMQAPPDYVHRPCHAFGLYQKTSRVHMCIGGVSNTF
ncbi:hypothetical protein K474DRAFT_572549 [Panus rudis PR-1116 ss-1]|nr:hypothetical protein K474DRAFT_572549 [Panus rudis PR-1116 ss-1]